MSTTRILLADDHALVRAGFRALLHELGMQVVAEANNGNEALRLVELHQPEIVIIDITGVSVVDTQVANALVRAAQAVKLLGAQVMLTGIRPEVAQTLVGLGAELPIVTRGTLQSGIEYAMRRP